MKKKIILNLAWKDTITASVFIQCWKTPAYWESRFMAEKTVKKKISFFINFENFTYERQSNYKHVVNGSNNAPTFDDIWNHTEAFGVNGGVKLRW